MHIFPNQNKVQGTLQNIARVHYSENERELGQISCVIMLTIFFFSSIFSIGHATIRELSLTILVSLITLGFISYFANKLRNIWFSVLLISALIIILPYLPLLKFLIYFFGLLGLLWLFKKIDLKILNWKLIISIFILIIGINFFSNFKFRELLDAGALHRDTYFHSAISAMYKNYGVISLGFDGLVPVKYHVFSHKLIAGYSVMSGLSVIETYSFLYIVIFPSAFIIALAQFSISFNNSMRLNEALILVVLSLIIIGRFPLFRYVGLDEPFFWSESMCISLIYLLGSLMTFKLYYESEESRSSYLHLLISILLFIISGLTKGSTAIVGLGFLCYFIIFKYHRSFLFLALGFLAAVLILFNFREIIINQLKPENIKLFAFIFKAVKWSSDGLLNKIIQAILFFLIYLMPVWLAFILGSLDSKDFLKSIRFGILFSIFMSALIIGLIFNQLEKNEQFFLIIPVIISIPFIISYCSEKEMITIRKFLLPTIVVMFIYTGYNSYRTGIAGNHNYISTLFRPISPKPILVELNSQLISIRDTSAKKAYIHVNNYESLINEMGCRAYWMIPAVSERAAVKGVPDTSRCRILGYGIDDYLKPYPVLFDQNRDQIINVELK